MKKAILVALLVGSKFAICHAQSLEFGSVRLRPGMPADSAFELAGKEFQLTKLPDQNLWIAQPMGNPSAPTYGSLEIANRKLVRVTRDFTSAANTAEGLVQALLDALRLLPARAVGGGWVDTPQCAVARRETVQAGGKTLQLMTLSCGLFETTVQAFDFRGERQIMVSTSLQAR